jgi:hypothetical protein
MNDRIIHDDFAFEMYDSYPGTRWNGGRPTSTEAEYALEAFTHQVERLNNHDIGFNFTFSNLLLEKEHLDDQLGNHLLERFHNGRNGVIAGSDVLARYIRKTFPKYRLIHTLTHYRMDLDYLKRALDLYDILVLPPALNHRFDWIEELGPDRVEILVNETCHRNCPFSRDHYTKISQYNLSLGKNPYLEEKVRQYCEKHHSQRLWPMSAEELGKKLVGTSMTPAEVGTLVELGVSRFKLSARTWIGRIHQDILGDIKAFILSRMESSTVEDIPHFVISVIGLNIKAFEALS